jgi:REP element-mobilizing transposase RayT
MPRQARLDVAGALHHIMARGINKSAIFEDDQDRIRFLERLGKTVIEGKCTVYAWVLMSNHVHILFKSGKDGISAVMRKLLTWYALYFNRRHRRSGHLFENRYKSILCDEENYLLALVRYIHLNPIRVGIIQTLEELNNYPWSGHRAIVGRAKHPWMDIDTVLSQFGKTKRKAITAYRRFVQEDVGKGRNPALTGGGLIRSRGGWSEVLSMRRKGLEEEADERILGDGDFVQEILKEAEEKHLRQLKLRKSGLNIAEIIRQECKKSKISPEELKRGSRRRRVSEARAAIAIRSSKELGLSGAEIARDLGVNTSSINRAIACAEDTASE